MGPNAKARWKRYHKIDKGRIPRRQIGVLYPQPPRRKKLEVSKPPVDPVDSDACLVHRVLNAPKRKPTNKAPKKKEEETPKKKEEESEEEESADEKSRTEEEAQSGDEEGHAAEAIYVNPPRPPNPPMPSESKRGYSRIRKWRLKKARQQAEDDKATDEKKEKMSYGSPYCQRCREVDELTLVPVADDAMYLSPDDDFGGDENLKLRVIRYRRKKWLTGGFDADCHPSYLTFGGIFQPYHYRFVVGFDRMVHGSAKYAISEYNRLKEFFFLLKLKQKLTLLKILNVTAETAGCYIFYVTFEGVNELLISKGTPDIIHTYQTVVTCALWFIGNHEVFIFKRKFDDKLSGDGPLRRKNFREKHLLRPEPSYAELTREKREKWWTLEAGVKNGGP